MSIKAVLKGVGAALAITAVFIVIMAAVLYFSDIDEGIIKIAYTLALPRE